MGCVAIFVYFFLRSTYLLGSLNRRQRATLYRQVVMVLARHSRSLWTRLRSRRRPSRLRCPSRVTTGELTVTRGRQTTATVRPHRATVSRPRHRGRRLNQTQSPHQRLLLPITFTHTHTHTRTRTHRCFVVLIQYWHWSTTTVDCTDIIASPYLFKCYII